MAILKRATMWSAITLAVMSVTACSGDNEGLSDQTSTSSSAPVASGSGSEVPNAPVTFDQSSALADGEVTGEEMQSALEAAVACFIDVGLGADVELADPAVGLAGGWELRFEAPGAGQSAEAVACRAATIGDLEFAFLVGSPGAANDRMDRLRDCLAELDVPTDAESLEDLIARQDASLIEQCGV